MFVFYELGLFPLLSAVLRDGRAREKVLYGSDFYMVETVDTKLEFFKRARQL